LAPPIKDSLPLLTLCSFQGAGIFGLELLSFLEQLSLSKALEVLILKTPRDARKLVTNTMSGAKTLVSCGVVMQPQELLGINQKD